MVTITTHSAAETERFAASLAPFLQGGMVLAFFGGLGMGKTAFVRGLAAAHCPEAQVSSPTFALVNEYGGSPPLVHFDMYRVDGYEDLLTTGFFDYLDMGAAVAVEWSENIADALPPDTVRITFERVDDTTRTITVEGLPL